MTEHESYHDAAKAVLPDGTMYATVSKVSVLGSSREYYAVDGLYRVFTPVWARRHTHFSVMGKES
jgi:hypothetical protein